MYFLIPWYIYFFIIKCILDCPIGILVDLSEPTSASLTLSPLSLEEEEEDKENAIPLTGKNHRAPLCLQSLGDFIEKPEITGASPSLGFLDLPQKIYWFCIGFCIHVNVN